MPDHHFISYSTSDAQDFAIKLCDALTAGPPPVAAWLDKREIKTGDYWDDQLVEAIRSCVSFIFIMTRESVKSNSICKNELIRAFRYRKPVIPILLHKDAEIPMQIEKSKKEKLSNWRSNSMKLYKKSGSLAIFS